MSHPTIPCTKCGHPTRGGRVTIAQAPGSFVRKSGMCQRCYKESHPKKDYKKLSRERMAAEVVDVAHIRIGLDGFIAERRARLARRAS